MTATASVADRAGGGAPAGSSSDERPNGGAERWLRQLWPLPVALAVLAAVALVPDWGDSGPAPGEAFVSVEGSARVERVGGDVELLVGGGGAGPAEATLRRGDVLDMSSGRADLELAGTARMEAVAGTELAMGRTPALQRGDLLVTGEEPVAVAAGRTRVVLGGADERPAAARLRLSAGLSVGVYRASVRIDSVGETRSVGALRRADVPADGEVTGARPLAYEADDPWDRRFLGDAVALDRELASLLRGFAASAGRDAGTPATLATVLRDVEGVSGRAQLARLVDPDRPAGDLLVGATISGLARGGTYAERWRASFGFRDAGATWGLVAMDRGVASDQVLRGLATAIEAADLDFEDDGGGAAPPSAPTTTAEPPGDVEPGGAGGAPDGGGGGGDEPGAGGPTTPTTPTLPGVPTTPPITLTPTTLPDPVGDIVDGLGDAVDGLLDGIGGLIQPSPADEDAPDCLPGLVCT